MPNSLFAYLYEEREGSIETSGSSPVFKLSEITKLYEKRLNDFGIETMRVNSHHLKNRLLGLCPEIRSFNQGRDCYIAFDEDIGDILKDAKEHNYDDDAVVLAKGADIIRPEFRIEVSWSLDQIDCQEEWIPKTFLRFIQMVLRGTNIQTDVDNSSTKQADLTISQLIMYNSYIRQRKDRKSITAYHSKVREMLLAVYWGLLLHSQTRQKNLIDKLYFLGLSVSYERVLEIDTVTGNKIVNDLN